MVDDSVRINSSFLSLYGCVLWILELVKFRHFPLLSGDGGSSGVEEERSSVGE